MPSGVFWTTAIPAESVRIDLDLGTASLQFSGVTVQDEGASPAVPATVTVDVQWSDVTKRSSLQNTAQGFSGDFAETGATIAWSAAQDGFSFASDAAATTRTNFAVIGRERNGAFALAERVPVQLPSGKG